MLANLELALGTLVVLALVVFVMIRVMLGKFRRASAKRDAAYQAIPPTAIRELVQGARVRIVGTANGTDLVPAPFSGTNCIAFHAKSFASTGEGRTRRTFDQNSQDVRPFEVADGTGTIAVDITHVNLDLSIHVVPDEVTKQHAFGSSMLARDGASPSYYEHILEPATQVAIIGTVGRGGDGALRLVGTAEAPLVVTNHRGALVARPNVGPSR